MTTLRSLLHHDTPQPGFPHIESVSPQVALPDVTVVYIEGCCFGDPPAIESIILYGPYPNASRGKCR